MTGSLHIKNGKYYAVLNVYEKGVRKQKWISSGLEVRGNKREAEKFLMHAKIDYKKQLEEQELSKEIPYFHDYMLDWLESRKGLLEVSTWESNETYVKTHLVPYWKKKKLRLHEVTPRQIQDYYNHKLKGGRKDRKPGGLSSETIKKHASVMKMVLNKAVILEYIQRSPASIVPLPKTTEGKRVPTFLTAKEANEVLRAFRGHELQPVVYITLYYGLRRSEVLGLKWDAIDFDKDIIKIQHTVVKNRRIVAKDRTKNQGSRGSYQLLPEVKEVLLMLKKEQEKNQQLFGASYEKSGYIFVRPDGGA